jgi:predicted RNase H-like HicB family nuclease
MDKPLYVHADWDAEAGVWVATSNDVPGLATEAETVEALVVKLEILIPELLEANGAAADQGIAFELLARRFDQVRPAA